MCGLFRIEESLDLREKFGLEVVFEDVFEILVVPDCLLLGTKLLSLLFKAR